MNKDLDLTEDDETLVDQETIEVESDVEPKAPKSKAASTEVPEDIADKKPSIRDALKHAIKKEQAETEEQKPSEKKPVKKAPAKSAAESEVSDEDVEEIKDLSSEKSEDKVIKPVTTKTDIKPPVGWTAEAKAKFSSLPPEVQASVAKREQEVSDGFKKYGEETARYKELESVLAPRREAIKQFGQSEAATVNQLFNWMEALTHSNRDYAYQQFIQLGKNFGLEIKQPSTAAPAGTQSQAPKNEEIPDTLKNFMDTVGGKLSTLEQTLKAQKDQEAQQYVNNWAKDKPHFNTVRTYMFSLLQSGVIPLKDGGLDLDAAYDAAVNANPTTRELLRQENEQKALQAATEKKQKAEAERLAKLKKAKAASASLSTRAPSGNSAALNGKAPKKFASIRDSIQAAIQEVSEE